MSGIRIRIIALMVMVFTWTINMNQSCAQVRDSLSHRKLKLAIVLPFELSRNSGVDASNPDGPGVHPYSMPSLHFYEGARLAIDSLLKNGYDFEYAAFETPQDSAGLRRMFIEMKSDSFNVVVGSFSDNLVAYAVDFTSRFQMKLVLTQALSPKACKGKDHCLIAFASTSSQCRFAVQKLKIGRAHV